MMKAKEKVLAYALAAAIVVAPFAGCASQSGSTSSSTDSASAAGSEATSQTGASNSTTISATTGNDVYMLYLGTNDKDTNQPVYSPEESKERAKAILIKHFGGYTIEDAEGGWKSDDGTVYQEYTMVIYLADTDIDKVHAAARELIDEYHQSSVLINTERVQTEFYNGE